MDTDQLTESAYGLIISAREVCDFLKSEIASSASRYLNEDEFLEGTLKQVGDVIDDPGGYLDSWNLLDETDTDEFLTKVRGLKKNVESVLNLPIEKRGPVPFE